METLKIKPNKNVFVWFGIAKSTLTYISTNAGLLLAAVLFADVSFLAFAIIGLVGGGAGLIFFVLTRFVQYSKESYEFRDDKLIFNSGGLFNDRQVELKLTNVTLVDEVRPFVEYSLFETGYIHVESAGSGGAEILLSSIENSEATVAQLEDYLRAAGLNLQKSELVQTEKPSVIGALVSTGKWLVTAAFFLLGFSFFFSTPLVAIVENLGTGLALILGVVVLIVIFVAVLIAGTLRYFDLKYRLYEIYNDTIVYREGFLNKHYAFIPVENISDSETGQGLLAKIFGFYDVVVSTRGAGNEIRFEAMPNGLELEQNIDQVAKQMQKYLRGDLRGDVRGEVDSDGGSEQVLAAKSGSPNAASHEVRWDRKENWVVDDSYTKQMKMSLLKLMLGQLYFLIAVPVVVVLLLVGGEAALLAVLMIMGMLFFSTVSIISALIRYFANNYYVREGSLKSSYNFLSRNDREFSLSKVTSYELRRSWLDYLIGTCSMHFSSIGSGDRLVFVDVPYDPEVFESIARKLDMSSARTPVRVVRPNFNSYQYLLANFGLVVVVATLLPILLIIGLVAGAFLWFVLPVLLISAIAIVGHITYTWLYHRTARIEFHDNHFIKVAGIFTRQRKVLPRVFVKDVLVRRYPLISAGELKLNIAGDRFTEVSNERSNNAFQQPQYSYQDMFSSNNINLNYVTDVFSVADDVDSLILSKKQGYKFASEPEYVTKPSVLNEMLPLVPVSMIIPFLIPVAVYTLVSIMRRKFEVYDTRIVFRYGVIFDYRLSITYFQFDHIDRSQGFLNKLFKNGNVAVYTEGSSTVELSVNNIPDWIEFYELLDRKYRHIDDSAKTK